MHFLATACTAQIPACCSAYSLLDVDVAMLTASGTVSSFEEVIGRPAPAVHEPMHIKWCIGVFCVCLHARAFVVFLLQQVVVSKTLQDLDQALQSKDITPIGPIMHRRVTAKTLEGGVSKVDHTHLHPGGPLGLRCKRIKAGSWTGGV